MGEVVVLGVAVASLVVAVASLVVAWRGVRVAERREERETALARAFRNVRGGWSGR